MSTFREKYYKEIRNLMKERFSYKNIHQVPRLEKIVVNCVTKDCVSNSKMVENIKGDLAAITGQRAITAKAKKSIASFKVRKGMAMGALVTLRGERMYEFLERLVAISLPQVRDFRGLNPRGLDGRGNFNFGLREQIIFPEINYDKIDKVRGIGISITTTAKSNEEGRELLKFFGMPFRE